MWKSLDKPLLNLNKKTLIHGLKTPIYFDGYGTFSFNPQSTRNGPNEFKMIPQYDGNTNTCRYVGMILDNLYK